MTLGREVYFKVMSKKINGHNTVSPTVDNSGTSERLTRRKPLSRHRKSREHHGVRVEVREQLPGINSLLPFWFWGRIQLGGR